MSWHYRAPAKFPALFHNVTREAALTGEPVVFASSPSRADLEHIAEQFRWFKWCAAHDDGADKSLSNLVETYDFRSSIKEDEVGFILWLSARPTKVSEFIRLNPDLAREVLRECQ
jgi:hypothetical protein